MKDMFQIDFGEGYDQSKPLPKVKLSTSSDDVEKAKRKIEKAKQNGLEEMRIFNEAYNQFLESTKGLVLYKDVFTPIAYAVDSLTESVLKPILLGKEVHGMSENAYKDIRLGIFKELIERYEKEEEK